MFRRRETAILDRRDIGRERRRDGCLPGHEVLDEACFLARRDVKHVVHDQHLAGTIFTSADANGRDRQLLRDFSGQRGRNGFQNDQGCASFLVSETVGDQLGRTRIVLALHTITAQLVH